MSFFRCSPFLFSFLSNIFIILLHFSLPFLFPVSFLFLFSSFFLSFFLSCIDIFLFYLYFLLFLSFFLYFIFNPSLISFNLSLISSKSTGQSVGHAFHSRIPSTSAPSTFVQTDNFSTLAAKMKTHYLLKIIESNVINCKSLHLSWTSKLFIAVQKAKSKTGWRKT